MITFGLITVNQWQERSHLLQGLGCVGFVSLAELEKAYLDKDGSLKLEIEIVVVSATTYTPFSSFIKSVFTYFLIQILILIV